MAAAVALLVVLGIGVAIGLFVSHDHRGGASAAAPAAARASSPSLAPATTPARPEAAPGRYSMSAVANACDLVDPAPLTKWSSTPKPAVHREDPANGGSLLCELQYTSTAPTDGVGTDEAGISLQVEFAGTAAPPAYDGWKSTDTSAQPGWSSGDLAGLGGQSYWRWGTTGSHVGGTYIVGVQDSNVSVRVEAAVQRAAGEPEVTRADLATIAESQARTALDRLRKP